MAGGVAFAVICGVLSGLVVVYLRLSGIL